MARRVCDAPLPRCMPIPTHASFIRCANGNDLWIKALNEFLRIVSRADSGFNVGFVCLIVGAALRILRVLAWPAVFEIKMWIY